MELAHKYRTLLGKNGITTPLRLAHFFSQLDHESGLKPIRESLYYTIIKGLRATFYSPFKGKSDEFVAQYLRNSEKCANYVYSNRMGNGSVSSGDGYKYRGAGFIQTTGYNQYLALTKHTGIDYVNNPELLENEADAMIAALYYWTTNNLNRYSDKDDVKGLTRAINGGYNGFKHRKQLLQKYKVIFKV